jgi:transcriptional regulator with XRE-family HTH domain
VDRRPRRISPKPITDPSADWGLSTIDTMSDPDAQAVRDRLDRALRTSGLSLRQFTDALGTSPSRFSAYRSGRTAPSAAFLLHAERIARGLGRARRAGVPSSIEAIGALRGPVSRGDEDWAYALTLEIRDRVRDLLRRRRDLASAWDAQPPALDARWDALVAAFVSHEFNEAGLVAPRWTAQERANPEWVLDSPRLTDAEVKHQTPPWLAERNIYIAQKDLGTV